MIVENHQFIEKSWGYEQILVNDKENNYCAKILNIYPWKHTSCHKHRTKTETFHPLKGVADLVYCNGWDINVKISMVHGLSYTMPRGVTHQLQNNTNEIVQFLEVSNYHDDADTTRIHTGYMECDSTN